MKRLFFIILAAVMLMPIHAGGEEMKAMRLPEPRLKGGLSVEEAIQKRRSVRNYLSKDLPLEDISQLLWACQGVTDRKRALRASPSAGALYPLEIYLAKRDGLYHYIVDAHALDRVSDKDVRQALADAAFGQQFVAEAGIDIIVCAVYERITSKYGERGIRYTDMEAGHAAENVFLQAVALGLDSVAVGAFGDAVVAKVLGLPAGVKPLYILPVGYKK